MSSSGNFRALQCPPNSVIRDKLWTEIRVSNVCLALLNPQILTAYSQSILNSKSSILLPQISFMQPKFPIFNYLFSILSKKNGIFCSKGPQNSAISDKMSASVACTVCSFLKVWMEDDIWWKTTFDRSRYLMEDDLWQKTTFDRRRPLTEDDIWQ